MVQVNIVQVYIEWEDSGDCEQSNYLKEKKEICYD